MWLRRRKLMSLCFLSQILCILSSHLQSILILGYGGYVVRLKIMRSSLLHSTNIYYVLLCGMNHAWESRSGQDRQGFCPQESYSPLRQMRRNASLKRAQIGAGSKCRLLWWTRVDLIPGKWTWATPTVRWGFTMHLGQRKSSGAAAAGPAVSAEQRRQRRRWETSTALCSPLVHTGMWLPPTHEHVFHHTKVANAYQAYPMSMFSPE